MPRPPEIHQVLIAHIHAQQAMERHALAAQRLLQAGNHDAARAALAEAERQRALIEQIEAAYPHG